MNRLVLMMILLPGLKLFGQSVSKTERPIKERFKLEVSVGNFQPLNNHFKKQTYFAEQIRYSEEVAFKMSWNAQVGTSYQIYERPIGKNDWFFALELGVNARATILYSDVSIFSSCPNCTFYTSPEIRNYSSTAFQTSLAINNMVLFSHMWDSFELSMGINLRIGYLFYNHVRNIGNRTLTDTGNSVKLDESTSEWIDPVSSLRNYYAGMLASEVIVRIRPVSFKGVYFLLQMPMHPVRYSGQNTTTYYGANCGVGFKFSNR